MAFKVINNSVGPNGLIPTLLVFGAYLYIVKSNAPNPIVMLRNTPITPYTRPPASTNLATRD